MPMRHPRAPARRRDPVHRRQSRSPAQRGRHLRQGFVGHHEAILAGAAHEAARAQARQRARCGRVRRGHVGGGVHASRGPAAQDSRHRSEAVRTVHGPRPDAGAHRALRAPVRHAQLRGARRFLLGEHGGRHDLHDRRLLLGVRRTRPRAGEVVRDDRHRRRPPLESPEDRDLEVQARRRALHLDQPDPHRLLGDRRRVAADPAGDRRRAAARAHPRVDCAGTLRPRVPGALHERRPARESGRDERRVRHVRPDRGPEGGRLLRSAEQAVVGPRDRPAGAHAFRRCRSIPPGRVPAVRRHAGEALVPVAEGPRRGLHVRVGSRHHRHPGRGDPPACPRDGHHRARPEDRAADRVDRHLGQGARHRHRQSRRLPRDARARRALERIPHRSARWRS